MPEQEGRVVVSYDSALVGVCGGVVPALLFCYFEKVFREAGYPANGIQRRNLAAWRTGIGYKNPQPWFRHFYKIGVLHHGAQIYRAAVRAQREFFCPDRGGYVFYAMDIKRYGDAATLHRNSLLIEASLARAFGTALPAVTVSAHLGPRAAARRDAQQFISLLESLDRSNTSIGRN